MEGASTGRAKGRGEAWLLAAGLLAAGAVLYRLASGPRLPHSLPDSGTVLATLTGTSIPYDALGASCTTLAWTLWLWLTATLLLQLLLAAAGAATSGARWVRSLHVVIDPLTLPAVRRLVHGTAIAVTVAQLAARSVPAASAAPVASAQVAALSISSSAPLSHAEQDTIQTYTVRPGDSLWALAERFYGDGERWPEIVAANVGRRMPDGQVFPRNPVLQPGWILHIPDARPAPTAQSRVTYVVREGDTLSAIAQRFYGDVTAWPRILEANRDAHLANGWTLSNPNLIWPGLALTIPEVTPALPTLATPSPSAPKAATGSVAPLAASLRTAPPSPARTAPAPPPSAPTLPAPTPPRASSMATAAPPPPQQPRSTATAGPTVAPAAHTAAAVSAPPLPHATRATMPLPVPTLGLAALAALGAGGTVLLARRQRRDPGLPGDRDAGIPVRGGYADPAHAPTFARRLYGGGEPALLVAEQVQHVLAEQGLVGARIVAVREGRHTMTLTLGGSLAVRRRLLELEAILAERLSARVKTRATADADVTIQLSRLGQLRLVAPPSGDTLPPLPLVALGVLPTREALHLNWNTIGNTLIAGAPGGAATMVLTSVLAAITARCHPDALRVSVVAPRDALPSPLRSLPHLARPFVDLDTTDGMRALLDELAAELDRRARGNAGSSPEQLLVLSELGAVPEDDLLPLLERGPSLGIHVLAATVKPQAISDALVDAAGTVLSLRLSDEDQGVRYVGTPDTSTLDDGELLARLEGRVAVRLRAFRVEDRYLERLIEQMRAAYQGTEPRPGGSVEPERADEALQPQGSSGAVDPAEEQGIPTEGTPCGSPATTPPGAAPLVVRSRTPAGVAVAPEPPPAMPSATASAAETAYPTTAATVTESDPPSPSESKPLLYVRCFGPLQVACGDREISSMHQYQAWELLAYLLTHGGSVSRQEVFDTFWSGADDAVAGNRLDRLVFRLKKVLTAQAGEGARDLLCREHGRLKLDEAVIISDLQHFHTLLKELPRLPPEQVVPEIEAALALAVDELLAGAEYAWLEQPGEDGLTLREQYDEHLARLTHDLARRYRDGGEVDRAAVLFRKLLDDQPTLQPVARGLYRCYALLKDRAALEQAHARLVEALRRERAMAGTNGQDFTLHPKTIAAYQQALEAVLRQTEGPNSGT